MPLNRRQDWKRFSEKVMDRHLKQYVEAQYGNQGGDDQVSNWTPRQCMDALERYTNRFERNARGPIEQLRDMIKVSHYAQMIYDKLCIEFGIDNIYPNCNTCGRPDPECFCEHPEICGTCGCLKPSRKLCNCNECGDCGYPTSMCICPTDEDICKECGFPTSVCICIDRLHEVANGNKD